MVGVDLAHIGITMFLSRNSRQRIGNAVRAVEAEANGIAGMRGDALSPVIRRARITGVVSDSPSIGNPYRYSGSIYPGRWNVESLSQQSPVPATGEIYSDVPLEPNKWCAVIRVGNHWEALSFVQDEDAEDPPPEPGDPDYPPECGHPGNDPGGGGGGGGEGDDDDHPGTDPGGGLDGGGVDDDDHPGNNPTPPCADD